MTRAQHCSRWLLFVPPAVRSLSSLPVRLPAPVTPLRSTWLMDFLLYFPVHCPNPADKIFLLVPLSCLSLSPRLRLSSSYWDQQSAFWTRLPSKSRFWAAFAHFYPVAGPIPSPRKPLVPAPSVKVHYCRCHHGLLCLPRKWISEKEHACYIWQREEGFKLDLFIDLVKSTTPWTVRLMWHQLRQRLQDSGGRLRGGNFFSWVCCCQIVSCSCRQHTCSGICRKAREGIKKGKEGTSKEVLEWSEMGHGTKTFSKKHWMPQKA